MWFWYYYNSWFVSITTNTCNHCQSSEAVRQWSSTLTAYINALTVSIDVFCLLIITLWFVLLLYMYVPSLNTIQCEKCEIEETEKVQRRFTKRLKGLKNVWYSDRLCRLRLPSLELRRLHLDLIVCYKLVFGLAVWFPDV